jgi:hypothetical protein
MIAGSRTPTRWPTHGVPTSTRHAKAIVGKGDVVGVDIDPRDPEDAEELMSRFARASLTDEDTAELARTWTVDPRTAQLLAASCSTGAVTTYVRRVWSSRVQARGGCGPAVAPRMVRGR